MSEFHDTVSQSFSVTTTAAVLSERNGTRNYFYLLNTGAATVYIHFGELVDAVVDKSFPVVSGATFGPVNPGWGQINIFTSAGTATCIWAEA